MAKYRVNFTDGAEYYTNRFTAISRVYEVLSMLHKNMGIPKTGDDYVFITVDIYDEKYNEYRSDIFMSLMHSGIRILDSTDGHSVKLANFFKGDN